MEETKRLKEEILANKDKRKYIVEEREKEIASKTVCSASIGDATQAGGGSSSQTNGFWKEIELNICKSWPGLCRILL